MIQIKILFLLLFIPLLSNATELKPWFGNQYEAEFRVFALYQNYDSIATPDHENFKHDEERLLPSDYHSFKHSENDTFATFSAIYPFKKYSGEFEITGAHTRHQSHCIDNFRVTGRYHWLDDTIGDPCSVVSNITLTQPLSRALHDISSFHHGHIEGELSLSFGKKYGYALTKNYVFRWWNVLGLGIADEGSPWFRGDAAFEYNYDNTHQFRGFIHTLCGMGRNSLHPNDFKGYGSIQHRSIDLGIRYGYDMGCWGTLSIEYARRVYARNFPRDVNLVLFEYYLPFGSQIFTSY